MVAICSLLREARTLRRTRGTAKESASRLTTKSFHCFMYGRESTNAGAVASSSRVLTGLHSAPHSFEEHMVAAPDQPPPSWPCGGGGGGGWPAEVAAPGPYAILSRGPGSCRPVAAAGPAAARRRPGGPTVRRRSGVPSRHTRCRWEGGVVGARRTLRQTAPQTGGRAVAKFGPKQLQSRQSPRCYRLAAAPRPLNYVSGRQLPSLSPAPKHS